VSLQVGGLCAARPKICAEGNSTRILTTVVLVALWNWCPRNKQDFHRHSCSTPFFHIEKWWTSPVPVEKNRGNRNSTSPVPFMYTYVKN
jgi:hypothetical protein